MTRPLDGKIALVTGGSRGIGRAIATRFARDGARVILTYADNKTAAAEAVSTITADGGNAAALRLDLGDQEAIPGFIAALRARLDTFGAGGLDILVNNAGIGVFASVLETTPTDLARVIATNITGTVLVTQSVAPLLNPSGRVITISSGLSKRPSPMFGVYSMTKAALDAFTVLIAAELAPRGITANTLAPGWTATDINAAAREDASLVAEVESQTGFGRLGLPEDIAAAAALLASPDSAWVTGQYIEASGGFRLV